MRKAIFDNGIVYNGDSLAMLREFPDASVDAVVTDPPYSSGGLHAGARRVDPAQKYQATGTKRSYPPMLGDLKDQRSFIMWATLWLSECWRLAKPGAPALVFSDWRQLPAMTDAVHAAKAPAKTFTRRCFPGVYAHHVRVADKVHLTGKPVSLLVDLLQVTPEGGTILDPFLGGGTTALACLKTGRRFVGVELSAEYFELAGERIQAACLR